MKTRATAGGDLADVEVVHRDAAQILEVRLPPLPADRARALFPGVWPDPRVRGCSWRWTWNAEGRSRSRRNRDAGSRAARQAKIHRAIPEAGYTTVMELEDDEPLDRETPYRVRVEQRNGRRAWSSPIWVRDGGAGVGGGRRAVVFRGKRFLPRRRVASRLRRDIAERSSSAGLPCVAQNPATRTLRRACFARRQAPSEAWSGRRDLNP